MLNILSSLGFKSPKKSMASLTEDLILAATRQTKLSSVKALDVSKRDLEVVDSLLLNKMPLLEVLVLSDNNLAKVPNDLELRLLRKLDMSNNDIADVDFVERLTALQEINVEGNNRLDTSSSYIMLVLCPSLERINGKSTSTMKNFVRAKMLKLEEAVKELWDGEFADYYHSGMGENDIKQVTEDLTARALSMDVEMKLPYPEFRKFLITRSCMELVNQVQANRYTPQTPHYKVKVKSLSNRRNRPFTVLKEKTSNTPGKHTGGKHTPHQQSSAANPRTPSRPASPRKRARSPSPQSPVSSPRRQAATSPASSRPAKKRRTCMESAQECPTELSELPDYEPVHFLRCHFGDREAKRKGFGPSDPTDNITRIWCAAFEPDRENEGETTSTVATCGGNTVCLIDCGSGRVTKRFTQHKEHFFALTWTTLKLPKTGKKMNILAVGGWNGHIRLLHPEQLVCYKEIGSGRPNKSVHDFYVCSMMFHPTEPTWLFSGSSDATISLYDIGMPQLPDYENTKIMQLHLFDAPSAVLNLALTQGLLIGGCEDGCYAWKLSADMGASHKRLERQKRSTEFLLPKQEDWAVDGLTLVGKDLIASRCREDSSIYVWRVSAALQSRSKEAKVQPILRLDWTHTEEMFINIGASHGYGSPSLSYFAGLLASGDAKGNLHLYNILSAVTQSDTSLSEKPLQPSRVLQWPDLFIDNSKPENAKMGDIPHLEDTVMNCVAVSSEQDYIVGGTDANILCIWKRNK